MEMKWDKLLNSNRLGNIPPKTQSVRSPFNSDHDKIIFSGAFRRLAKKTQVHPLATNDHIHNRLTHSLEVACVGRSLGLLVGQELHRKKKLPRNTCVANIADIVQSTCLAHDIGNPPFGHTGEEAIRSWFSNGGGLYLENMKPCEANDLKTFEGNAQGLRILTTIENHLHDGGMRLTYATLASFIKYPWTSRPAVDGQRPNGKKYGVFTSELDVFKEIANNVGLTKQNGSDWYNRHPLVHLMEAADDFCYGIMDLEDGIEMNILKWDDVYEALRPALSRADISKIKSDNPKTSNTRKTSILRGKIIGYCVESAAKAFIKNLENYMNGDDTKNLISLCDTNIQESIKNAKELAQSEIFKHPRKIELEIGAYNVISTLLNVLCQAALNQDKSQNRLSFKNSRVLDLINVDSFKTANQELSSDYLVLMRVVDFVSGMTDNYATFLAKQFNGLGV